MVGYSTEVDVVRVRIAGTEQIHEEVRGEAVRPLHFVRNVGLEEHINIRV